MEVGISIVRKNILCDWDRNGIQIVVQHPGIWNSLKKLRRNSRQFRKPILVIPLWHLQFPLINYFSWLNIDPWFTSSFSPPNWRKVEIFIYIYLLFIILVAVLSDANKRLMYDVGVYDSDDDENVSHQLHTSPCSLTIASSSAHPILCTLFIPLQEKRSISQ